jgi:hypothetical protein
MMSQDILVANVTASLKYNGQRVCLVAGKTLVRADDPIVKGREDMFRPLAVGYLAGGPVEQATAAPGEKREITPKQNRRRAPATDKDGS